MLLGAGSISASAATITFDFGQLSATPGGSCNPGNCVLPGKVEQFFTTGGVTVGAIGYNGKNKIAYVTQKWGPFAGNGGETGLGESNTHPKPSDPDYEVTKSTWLLIDNTAALLAGYKSSSLSIESMQTGEGAHIYEYTGTTTSFDPTKLTLIATTENPSTGGVTQTITVPNNSNYLVVQAQGPASGSDVVVAQDVLSQSVPEPATLALLGGSLVGLGLIRRRPG